MQLRTGEKQWKYFRIEAAFFAVYFCLFPVLSSFEYNFIELRKANLLTGELVSALYYGLFNMATAIVYYKLVQRYLFKRRFAIFILATIIYLVIYHFYRSGLYYITAHLSLLPDSLQQNSLRWYNAHNRINFSTAYMSTQFLCIIALAYFIRSLQQEEQVKTLKEQQLLSELNYLKAQLHPHFFFNTLNNIYSLALKQSTDTAPMVARLGDMMRYILYEGDRKTVPLHREIEFLKNYIEVEKIRHGNNHIEFEVQGNTKGTYIEPLLLLPFIENAFKHGLEQETAGGFVSIVLCLDENGFTLEVVNSTPAQQRPASGGIGLQNVIKRLNILYPGRHQLSMNDENNRHQVSLTLQII
jgi:two-component system LytT family sensor kinase